MKAAAIILAAGQSRRMGRPKASLPFRKGTFLSVLADTLAEFCDPILAVFGSNELPAANALPVPNPDAALGMITSLQAGLRALPALPARILFTLVDHPAVTRDTLSILLAARGPIVIPRLNGKRGHPVIIEREIAHEFLAESATSKVRTVIDRHAEAIQYLEVRDPGINDDIDDPALYEALLARDAG